MLTRAAEHHIQMMVYYIQNHLAFFFFFYPCPASFREVFTTSNDGARGKIPADMMMMDAAGRMALDNDLGADTDEDEEEIVPESTESQEGSQVVDVTNFNLHYEVTTGMEMVGGAGGRPVFYAYYKGKMKEIFPGEDSVLKIPLAPVCGIRQFFINTRSSSAVPERLVKKRDLKGLILVGDPTYTFGSREQETLCKERYDFIVKQRHLSIHDLNDGGIPDKISNSEDEVYRMEYLPSDFYNNKVITKKHLSSIDLFSGIGGNALGLKKAGILPKVAIELCKFAHATYDDIHYEDEPVVLQRDVLDILEKIREAKSKGKNHVTVYKFQDGVDKNKRNLDHEYGRLKTTSTFRFDNFDVLHASPPCNDYSGANASMQRTRFEDRDPTMSQKHYFDTVPKFIELVEPPFIVVENVTGVAANNNSNRIDGAVEKLIQALSKLKYQITQCNLDAADYGVPQRRKRCIILGARPGYRLPDCRM